jgi:hypothetical protein
MEVLQIDSAEPGVVRVGIGDHADWLGPLRFTGAHASIRGVLEQHDASAAVLRIEAVEAVTGIATGVFANPSAAWSFNPAERHDGGVPENTVAFGFQYTEFAMPTVTDASMQGWFLFPARPALVLPMMLIAPDGRTLLLAPLSGFHEQILAVDGLRWGWHGDLDDVAAGFVTELALWAGSGPRACLDAWGAHLQARYGTRRPSRYADTVGARPSYWTDNGAAYWYRTEPGLDAAGSMVAAVDDLRANGVPLGSVQLDSWFYPHSTLRPFNTDEWLVPPTGLVEWDARPDILPDGVKALRQALGSPPLATHCRHLSTESPYVEEFACWIDGAQAHPQDASLYERWFDQAVQWGVETFEHDWLVECFLGVRGLREAPGRARAWQEGIDRAARERGLTLQWCMPTPADICQTVTLEQVTSIRTSGDHGYLVSAGYLWAWFLYTNAFAGALGLTPFKDVFSADVDNEGAHAEVEALLSALSTGPVGIGDRVGRADRDIVRRTCRADGLLVKPDEPVAALDRSFHRWATGRGALLVGSTTTTHAAGTWTYVVTLNATDQPVAGRVDLADLRGSPAGDALVWDWRGHRGEVVAPGGGWDVELPALGWDYRVVAPIVDGVAVVGDPALYATAGDMRIAAVERTPDHALHVTVLGADEHVELVTWTERDGIARVPVDVPRRGWERVVVS